MYLTFAMITSDYVNYVKNKLKDKHLGVNGPFLRMQTFGPWTTRESKYVKSLGRIILAFTLEQTHMLEQHDS